MGRRPFLRTLPSWVLLIRKLPGKMLTLPVPLSSSSRPSSKNGSPPRRCLSPDPSLGSYPILPGRKGDEKALDAV